MRCTSPISMQAGVWLTATEMELSATLTPWAIRLRRTIRTSLIKVIYCNSNNLSVQTCQDSCQKNWRSTWTGINPQCQISMPHCKLFPTVGQKNSYRVKVYGQCHGKSITSYSLLVQFDNNRALALLTTNKLFSRRSDKQRCYCT